MVDVMLIGVGRMEDNDTKASSSENESGDKKEVIFTRTGKILKKWRVPRTVSLRRIHSVEAQGWIKI